MMRRLGWSAAMLLALGWSGTVAAQGGTITGRVTTTGGAAPLAGINVSVANARPAVTDADGRYVLRNIAAGTDTVRFRWIGYAPRELVVSLEAGERLTLNVELEPEPVQLSQVRISGASRQFERVVDAPAAVSVVAPERVREMAGAGQVPLLVADLPGVRVAQSGVNDFNVNARGFNTPTNRRLLVLVDGRDVSVPILNNQDWADLSLGDPATRVEFVRGPGSALYGANAFSGVVAITTPAVRESRGTRVDLSGGEVSALRATASSAWLSDDYRWGFRAGAGYSTTQTPDVARTNLGDLEREYAAAGIPSGAARMPAPGYELIPLQGQTKSGVLGLPGAAAGTPDPLRTSFANARLDYYPANGAIVTAEGGWSRIENPVATLTAGRSQTLDATRPWGRLAWTSEGFSVMAYHTGRTGENISLASGQRGDDITSTTHVEGQLNRRFAGTRGRYVVGGSLRTVMVDTKGTLLSPADDGRSDRFYGAFGQVEYEPFARWKVIAAGRVDEGSLNETNFSPKVGVVYAPARDHAVRLTFNRGYLNPSVLERFISFPAGPPLDFSLLEAGLRASPLGPALAGVPNGTLFTTSNAVPLLALGNDQLRSSKVNGVEFGYKGQFDRLFLTADVYYSRISEFASGLLPGANPRYAPWTAPAAVPGAVAPGLEGAVAAAVGPGLTRLADGSTALVLSSGNFGEAREYGAELGVGVQVDRALRWDANYTYYGFAINQSAFYAGDTLLPNTPRHAANLSGSWTGAQGARVRLGWRWEDAHRWHAGVWQGFVPSSGSVDLNASVPAGERLTFSLSATDLLDQKRYHIYGGSIVGRRVIGGVSWRR